MPRYFRSMRLSSWAQLSIDQIIDTEFTNRNGTLDLELSVYEVNAPQECLQIFAEHLVSPRLGDPKQGSLIDLSHPSVFPVFNPGDCTFPFAKSRHHEFSFHDRQELALFLSHICQGLNGRELLVPAPALKTYVQHKLAADAQWQATIGSSKRWRKFLK